MVVIISSVSYVEVLPLSVSVYFSIPPSHFRPTGSLPPRIYGLPKILTNHPLHLGPLFHALSPPLIYQLAKYVASVISPLAGKTDSYVSNSKHFVEMMEDVLVDEGETMVSFDVSVTYRCSHSLS